METQKQADYLVELLKFSHEQRATDLHLCAGSKPLMRINQKLMDVPYTDMLKSAAVDSMLDGLLDEKKKAKLEADRVIDFSFSVSGLGRFRINIYSQRGTYAAAIRMLSIEIPNIHELGLPPSVASFASKTKGLFLVTGATGSGKSTTLAGLINLMNEDYQYHIITIEDPIEYLHKHKKSLVTQREIGQDARSFAEALRSALREDPDVIMVGEMRDPETVSIALTAAETGHLVLSTLHTIDAVKSIDRIIDTFPPEQQNQVRSQLATVLEGIVSQQLVPRVNEGGLVVASGVMFANPAIRNLIREGKHYQINSIMTTGSAQGMQLLESDLARLYNQGIISKEEAMFRALDKQLLIQFLNRG